jgi:hypothetical protein
MLALDTPIRRENEPFAPWRARHVMPRGITDCDLELAARPGVVRRDLHHSTSAAPAAIHIYPRRTP